MRKTEEGVALMMVLWVLLLLSFIALEFAHSMRTEVEITKNYRDEMQAYYIARAGVELGRYELAISGRLSPHCRDPETKRVVFGRGEGGECKKIPECRLFELGNGKCDYQFESAVDKHPLNELTKPDNSSARASLEKFLEKCGMEAFSEELSTIADSINDWVDPPSGTHRLNGAEDDWYESHDQGYECKDADFDSVDELSLIRGLRIEKYDSEEEIARKEKIVVTFKHYFSVNPELEAIKKGKGSKRRSFLINTASSEAIQMAYDIGLISELPENVQIKREEDCGCFNNDNPSGYYYIISIAVMNDSPVQRGIKASFLDPARRDYWKPLYWNDNYIPEYYDDPNQDELSQGDQG